MLKNSTKITSLLVAAATMATMAPAMAADKIADKDGKIYRAIAYKDSKFYIDGDDIQDAKDEDGAYFLNGGKATEVDDIDSGDEVTGVYGEKYVEIEEGDYYLDLSTGKVTDDQVRADDREDAASELAKKVRKDDPGRYTVKSRDDKAEVNFDGIDSQQDQIWEVPSAKYTKPYYQVDYLKYEDTDGRAGDAPDHVLDADGSLAKTATVYTDENGKYVDADHELGTVNIIINKGVEKGATTSDALKINPDERVSRAEALKFEKVGDKESDNENVKVHLYVEHINTLAQDKDYVYRLAALHVGVQIKPENSNSFGNIQMITTGQAVCFGSTKNPVSVKASENGRFYVIQKISKETDGDEHGANLPKTTETYLVTENKDWRKKKDSVYTNAGDRNIFGIGYKDNLEEDDKDGSWDENYGEKFADRANNDVAYVVADGKVTKYQTAFETLSDNGSADNDREEEKFVVRTFDLKKSNGMYYVDEDHNDDDFDDEDEFATTIDKDGNIWKLDSGKIYKYKNDGDYELKYKCDGGLNELSVYDENNLIAYNEDDDVYAIVGGKSSTGKYEVEDENKTTTTTTAQVGWYTNADGSWSYGNADGTKAIGWLQSPTSGLWYYMDANGIMMSNGWVQDGANWYFLGADGAMKTGWVYTGGAWYYLKETAGNKGAMQTGWIQTGGKWYYCNASGAMLSNTTVNGYKLGADGAWIK